MADRRPPTEADRLIMFCDLVDEYDEIAEAFPVDQKSFRIGGNPRPPSDRWSRIVRAMVLRKFVLQETDQAHLSKIALAIRSCDANGQGAELADAIEGRLTDSFGVVAYGPELRRADEIATDVVYGGFMHGDYDRWQRTKNRASVMVEHPLWEFTLDAESLVRQVRDGVRSLAAAGHLMVPGL